MIKKFRLWLIRHWRWYRHHKLYVVCDARDNSITLSHALFDMIDVMNQQEAKAFVFRLHDAFKINEKRYAFIINPQFDQPTQLCDIQYNSKHRSVGFETLCPTVNRIFYDYGLPVDACVKLSVEPALNAKDNYYIILPPKK